MPADDQTPSSGPELSEEAASRVNTLFAPEDRDPAKHLLRDPGVESDRLRFAALKYSDGDLHKLESAVRLANVDFRDLLMAVGFGDPNSHTRWHPKPYGDPALIDPVAIAEVIHQHLATLLSPLGFQRDASEWNRMMDFRQNLRLGTGLTNRTETRFFLHLKLEASPKPIVLHLPLLPASMSNDREQGYIFRAGEGEAPVFRIEADITAEAVPLFERFTSNQEVSRGFTDGSFKPHVPVTGEAWLIRRR